MAKSSLPGHALGWIGTGRMGFPMARRLAQAGARLAAYNRTRAKAEPLAEHGAKIVDSPADLGGCDVVFTMVAASDDLRAVTLGKKGVLSRPRRAPRILVDCSTVSAEASAEVREAAERCGTQMLAAPVSGNGKVVQAGKLSFVVSGPRRAYDEVLPWLQTMGVAASYVGEGELARIIKICHNVFLGVVIQSLSELTVLAEKTGVPRHAFLDFINKSVMGSTFSRYKTPALVKLDFTPTFTSALLRKDMDLGLAAARARDVPMPLAAAAREAIQSLVGNGYMDEDFARLITLQARNAGLSLKSEKVAVDDGLSDRKK